MEEAVAEHLIEKSGGRLAKEVLDPVPGGEDRGAVIDVDPAYPLQCQHGAAGAQPIDPGHPEIRVAGEILAELSGRGSLEPQIHFNPDDFGQCPNNLDRFEPPQGGL